MECTKTFLKLFFTIPFFIGLLGAQVSLGNEIRFAAIGDAGNGNKGQYKVGQTLAKYCQIHGCEFVAYLGDNFYKVGVTSTGDKQWLDKFEAPYKDLDIPFVAVLGNHDYGTLGNEFGKGKHQVEYSGLQGKWFMPNYYYSFPHKGSMLVGLDTNRIMWNKKQDAKAQAQLLQKSLSNPALGWKIAMGHHPYVSNGKHGNAGRYERLPK